MMKVHLATVFFSMLFLTSCAQRGLVQTTEKPTTTEEKTMIQNDMALYSADCITEAEVIEAQKEWGEGIVKIGKVYSDGGDYEKAAMNHIQDLYAYDLSSVLFKPTLASVEQFRGSFDGALSYFVGGNKTYPEDKGFAIKPWTNVRWQNTGIINNSCNMAIAMGNYFFTTTDGDEVKVEYTLGYVKDKAGDLRIVVHKSSMPYNPNPEN